jgi:hypothetical protein
MQDVLCLAPYPFRLESLHEFDPLSDFDMMGGDDVWYARPQLFFSCTLCPTGQMGDRGSHREVSLVFFSTFEPIDLQRDSVLQRNGIPMLYERAASQLPTLYVCPVENALGRAPLIPCYMMGHKHNSPWKIDERDCQQVGWGWGLHSRPRALIPAPPRPSSGSFSEAKTSIRFSFCF